MSKSKRKRNRKFIPTGEKCQGFTRRCAICGKLRLTANRIVENRIEHYHCLCRKDGGDYMTRADGERKPCQKGAVNGTNRCEFHGGAALRGEAHPNFKHGRYSKVIPQRYVEAYARSYDDDQITQLREQISLCDAREHELVSQLKEGGVSKVIQDVQKSGRALAKMFDRIESEQDVENAKVKFERIMALVDEIQENEATWDKIHKNMEQRRVLAETENRAKEKLQGVVLPEQLIAFQTQLIQILRATINDKVVLNEIAAKMRTLAGMDQPMLPAETVEAEVVAEVQ